MCDCQNNEASSITFHEDYVNMKTQYVLYLLYVNVEQPCILGVTVLVFDGFFSPKCQKFSIRQKGEWTFFIEMTT